MSNSPKNLNVSICKQRSRSIIKAIDQRKYTSQKFISFDNTYKVSSNEMREVRKDRRGNSIKLNGSHQIVINDEVDIKEFSKQSEKNSVELMDQFESPSDIKKKKIDKDQISQEQPRTQSIQLNEIQSQLRLSYLNYMSTKIQKKLEDQPQEEKKPNQICKKTSCRCSIF